MKPIKILSLLFLSLLLMSCRKDDDNGNEEDTPSGYFLKANIDNANFLAQGEMYCTYTNLAGMVVITGINNNTSMFTITSSYGLKIGTYSASSSQPSNLIFQYVENNVNYTTAETHEGTLEITNIDTASKTLKGKFSFKGKELNGTKVKTITAGEFQCKGRN